MSKSYNELKEMKVGEVYYESSQYGNIKFTVKSAPVETYNEGLQRNQIRWVGAVEGSEDIHFLTTEGLEHYGPRIYDFPAYVGVKEIGY